MICGDRFSGLAVVEDMEDGLHDKVIGALNVQGETVPLTYVTRDGLWTIVIPPNFPTDYASIPRLLWAAIPPRGKYNRGAIVHDLLYTFAPIDPRTGLRVTQAAADAILLEACENLCVRATQRWTIWAGLRMGGFVAWRNHRKEDARG